MNTKLTMTLLIIIGLISFISAHHENRIAQERNYISSIKYLGNYPKDKYGSWTKGLQGVGNNNDYWFFTQKRTIWKMPKNIEFEHTKNLKPTVKNGVLRKNMPPILQQRGYNHFGDLDEKIVSFLFQLKSKTIILLKL